MSKDLAHALALFAMSQGAEARMTREWAILKMDSFFKGYEHESLIKEVWKVIRAALAELPNTSTNTTMVAPAQICPECSSPLYYCANANKMACIECAWVDPGKLHHS